MHWLTTNEVYKGFWEDNLQNGFGIHLWLEEPGKLKSLRNRYEGMWYNGLRNGYGTFYYSDGSRYDGEWQENMKEGFACFLDPSGDFMEAIFKNDRLLQRLNEPRKIEMHALVADESEDSGDNQDKKKNIRLKGKKGASKDKGAKDKEKDKPASPAKAAPPRRTREKKVEETPNVAMNKEMEFNKRNLENQVLNPYLQLLRVDDLLEKVQNRSEVLGNLEISLLHHNSMLTDVFKEYKALRTNITEISCTMTLRSFWTFLRTARILSPSLSLAVFDRYFYENPHNKFVLHYDFKDLRNKMKNLKLTHYSSNPRKLDVLKKLDVYMRNDDVKLTLQKLDYGSTFAKSVDRVDEDQKAQFEEDPLEKTIQTQMQQMQIKPFNIHDPNNLIQFRNFIDGIIRAVYIRENFKFDNIGEDLERKYIKHRIEPIVYHKKHMLEKVFASEEEDKLRQFIQDYKIEEMPTMKELFKKHLATKTVFNEDVEILISNVEALRLLLQSGGMVKDENENVKFFKVVERYFDPDSSYIELLTKKIELRRHYNRQETLDLGFSQMDGSVDMDQSANGSVIRERRKPSMKLDKPPELPIAPIEIGSALEKQNSGLLDIHKIDEEESRRSGKNNIVQKHSQRDVLIKDRNTIIDYQEILHPDQEKETVKQREMRNFETQPISTILTCLLGHELLYFEFIENLLLYLLVTVISNLILGQNQALEAVRSLSNRLSTQVAPEELLQDQSQQKEMVDYKGGQRAI